MASSLEVIEVEDGSPHRPYVDWPAVFAGAFIAVASALVLTAVGAAIGLSMVSPWEEAPSATAVSLSAAAWLALTALYSAAVGGYVAGRMRTPVRDATADEDQLRDGLNGLIVWAIGITASAVLAVMAATSLGSAAVKVGSSAMQAAGTAAAGASDKLSDQAIGYYLDRAFRSSPTASANAPAQAQETRSEALRIVVNSVASGSLSDEDKTYLASLVASRTGLSEADAAKRIDTFVNDTQAAATQLEATARDTADKARKAVALAGTLNAVISFLAGLLAAFAAQIGGRHRDTNILSARGRTS